MPRYIDLNNPMIIHMGRDKFGNGIYHIPPDLPTADVVEKERYDILLEQLLEHANILAQEMRKYQNADVPERNVGKWIKVGDNSYRCSVCDEVSCCNGNFCPDCGADMRGEEGE